VKSLRIIIALSYFLALKTLGAITSLCDLQCENRVNPEGIDVPKPRLSWVIISDQRGVKQIAYQVLAASSLKLLAGDHGDLWDSGKVSADRSLNVEYAGSQLVSRQQCFWKVRVWTKDGKPSAWSQYAYWSMGLLNLADWQASWIADPVLADPTNRPLTPIHCYRSPLTNEPSCSKWITLDLGATKSLDAVDLLAARPVKQSHDFRSVMFPLRFKIETANAVDFNRAQMVVDQTVTDYPNPRFQKCHFTFNNVKARFVRLSVSRLSCWDGQDYGLALGGFQVFDGTNLISLNAKVDCSDSMETENWSKRFLVDGLGDVALAPDSPAIVLDVPGVPPAHTVSRVPMLRREFELSGTIRRAVLSVTARGFYEVHLNGRRVGDELLAPGYTSYRQRLQYQTHDVTALLKQGKNCIGALVGYGWYAGHMNLYENRCFDGTFPQFLAQLDIELADGRKVTLTTDGQWRSTLNGPVRYSDLLDGEAHDCRQEISGWDQSGFDDRAWNPVWTQPRDDTPLIWQRCQPVRAIQEMHPVATKEVTPGVYVLDLGQEITGWCRLKAKGPAGTHLTLRHAEIVDKDGNVDLRNLWGVAQQDDYFLDGKGEHTLEPHFTYHGFRYVEVTGLTEPPNADTLVALNIHSALPDAGEFNCSNDLYNRIMSAARWTQRNLLFDVPAGCAARGERVSWLGDVRPCVQSTCFNFDAAAFFTKYAQDIRDAQKPDGRYCDITPHAHLRGTEICVGSAGWADCGVSLPWEVYVYYGDLRALAEHFESARLWVDFVAERNPDFIWKNGRGMNDWGDWMSASKRGTPKELGATAFFAHSADLVGRMAAVLGRADDEDKYRKLFENIKRAFLQKYVSPDGIISAYPGSVDGETAQGNYALAIGFDLLDEPLKSRALEHLSTAIEKADGHPTIGFWSPAALLMVLSANGHHADAAKMLGLETPPSWGYMALHSGTFWESFDSDVKNHSLNHWTHSSVGEWMWRNIAGINPDETNPGYASFVIHPRPCKEVSWCKAKYNSASGLIKVGWRLDNQGFTLDLQVPPNSSAMVYVPAKEPGIVREGGHRASESKGVKWLRQEGEASIFSVESGSYHFTVDHR